MESRGEGYKVPDEVAVAALRASFRTYTGRFHCAITGVEIEEEDIEHPAAGQWEHVNARGDGHVAIAAQVINQMKGNLPLEHFQNLVIQLGRMFDGQRHDPERLKQLINSAPRTPHPRRKSGNAESQPG